jgi:cyclitol reductase
MKLYSLPASFKVVNLTDSGPVLEEQQMPKLIAGHDYVVVKPIFVGICRSDLREVSKERVTRHDFGHEIVARLVYTSHSFPTDLNSIVCFDPHIPIYRTSGFGEYIFASGTMNNLVAAFPKCPSALDYQKSVFMEPLACAHHAISRLKQSLKVTDLSGLNIGILGAGNAGILMGLIAKHWGANISLITKNQIRKSFLVERNLFDKDEILTGELKNNVFDSVILATTWLDDNVFNSGLSLLGDEGILLLFGGTNPADVVGGRGINLDDIRRNQKELFYKHKNRNLLISGTYGVESQDIEASFTLLQISRDFPVERLIVDTVSLNELSELLLGLTTNKKYFLGKILVKM